MRIESARVRNYRCVQDSGSFDVEPDKTILVGINEAGKTAILRGLQQVSRPKDVPPIDWLYDAPASQVDDIRRGRLERGALPVADVVMAPEAEDLAGLALPDGAENIRLVMTSYMDSNRTYLVAGMPTRPLISHLDKALLRLTSAMGKQSDQEAKSMAERLVRWKADHVHEALGGTAYTELRTLLDEALPLFDEGSAAEKHWDTLDEVLKSTATLDKVGKHLLDRMPPFVYYSSYFSVRPRIHLNRLAERQASGELDMNYDFGNLQLLKFLGFTAKELSEMDSEAPDKPYNYDSDVAALQQYKAALVLHERRVAERKKALHAAGTRLTQEIRRVWNDKTITLRLDVDGSTCRRSSRTTPVSPSNWISAARASAGWCPSSSSSTPRPPTTSRTPFCSWTSRA